MSVRSRLIGLAVFIVAAVLLALTSPRAPDEPITAQRIIIRNSNDPDNPTPPGSSDNPIAANRLPCGSQTLPEQCWALAGATITHRTMACYTDTGGLDTAADLNSAISSCPAGQVVQLQAGTYNFSNAMLLSVSNITFRGAGANSTFLVFTNDTGNVCAFGGVICFQGDQGNYLESTIRFSSNWTAGYAKGDDEITLTDASNVAVGYNINIDQTNTDGSDPYPTGWYCGVDPGCLVCGEPPGAGCAAAAGGGEGGVRPGRQQTQSVKVTAKNGNVLTITPPLIHGNWASGRDPEAWFGNATITGVGVEDMSVQCIDTCGTGIFDMMNATGNWVARVRSWTVGNGSEPEFCRAHVWLEQASFNTIRDSYFFSGACHGATSYGIECQSCGHNLVENNIFHWITAPVMNNGGGAGNVIAYNFTVNQEFSGGLTYDFAGLWNHGGGGDYILYEGNDTSGYNADVQHGPGQFDTAFRNHFWGRELTHTDSTNTFNIRPLNRFHNYLGNVQGTSGYHTQYQCYPGSCADGDLSIYWLGIGYPSDIGPTDDVNVKNSLFRWGNWDVVTSTADSTNGDQTGTRWCGNSSNTGWAARCGSVSEVPTGIGGSYQQTIPSTEALPASLYRSSKPPFFKSSDPFPLYGPDVSGGSISNVGGHAYPNPARQCYLTVMGGTFSGTTVLPFTCSYPLP